MEWGRGTGLEQRRGKMENLEKGNYKIPVFQGCPTFSLCRSFLSVGRRAAGWLLVVLVLESNKPICGLVAPLGVQSPLPGTLRDLSSRHSGDALVQRRSSFQEDCARWDGLTWGPKPSGFSRCRPSQLTMALFPSGSHLVCGRVLWAWRRGGGWADAEQLWAGSLWGVDFTSEAESVWFSLKHGTSSVMVFKMSFALYKFMEKGRMLKSLKANFVLNTKVLLWKKLIPTKCLAVKRLTYN